MNYFSKQDVYDILQICELSMKGFDSGIEMEDIVFSLSNIDDTTFEDIEYFFNKDGEDEYGEDFIKDNEGNILEEGPMKINIEINSTILEDYNAPFEDKENNGDINKYFDNKILLYKYLKNLSNILEIENFQISELSTNYCVEITIKNLSEHVIQESLPRQSTVDQLKKLRKITKGTDIGDRVINNKLGNLIDDSNPISRVESYEAFTKKNKSFTPSWNTKGMILPFKNKLDK